MTRRADPVRIFQARRIAARNGLTDHGMSLEDAERWCDAWELEAATRDVARDDEAYWRFGVEWIAAERSMRRPGWA
jgi:hypothetical protein